jgi:hypothetical protein
MKDTDIKNVTPPAFAKATARQAQPPLILRGGLIDASHETETSFISSDPWNIPVRSGSGPYKIIRENPSVWPVRRTGR